MAEYFPPGLEELEESPSNRTSTNLIETQGMSKYLPLQGNFNT